MGWTGRATGRRCDRRSRVAAPPNPLCSWPAGGGTRRAGAHLHARNAALVAGIAVLVLVLVLALWTLAVTPAEHSAAASFTAVPRSLAAAFAPALAGAWFAAGWTALPLVACGVLKVAYDLALWRSCRGLRLVAD